MKRLAVVLLLFVSVGPVRAESLEDIWQGFALAWKSKRAELLSAKASQKEAQAKFIEYFDFMRQRHRGLTSAQNRVIPPTTDDMGELLDGYLVSADGQFLYWGSGLSSEHDQIPHVLWGRAHLPLGRFEVIDVKGGRHVWTELTLTTEEGTVPLRIRGVTLPTGLLLVRQQAWQDAARILTDQLLEIKQRPIESNESIQLVLTPEIRKEFAKGKAAFVEWTTIQLLSLGRYHERQHARDIVYLSSELFGRTEELAELYLETRAWLSTFAEVEDIGQLRLCWWLLSERGDRLIQQRTSSSVFTWIGTTLGEIAADTPDGPVTAEKALTVMTKPLREIKTAAMRALDKTTDRQEFVLAQLRK